MNVKIVTNFKEANELFESLNLTKKKAVLRSAMREALKPVLVEAKASYKSEINSKTGQGFRSLGTALVGKSSDIGVGTGARVKGGYSGWYVKFQNAGTDDRYHKNGKWVGKIKPTSFFSKVAESKQDDVVNNAADNLINTLNRFIYRGSIV